MYSVLLVDDEMLDLEGMRRFIPWGDLGVKVAAAVNNAFDACDILEQLPIDIMVSDINMPNMSGLELARTAIEKNPDIRIIFVSGYQDFSYVKQALSLKACSYILKPMDDNELIANLQKVKQELDDERKRRDAEEAFQHMIPMAKNNLLLRLFEGDWDGIHEDGMHKLITTYGLDRLTWPVRAALIELDVLSWPQQDIHNEQSLIKNFIDQVNEIGRSYGIPHCCKVSAHRFVLLIEDHRMTAFTQDIVDTISARLSISTTIGVGGPALNLEDLYMSYTQALEAVDSKMFIGKGQLIMYESVNRDPEMIDAVPLMFGWKLSFMR